MTACCSFSVPVYRARYSTTSHSFPSCGERPIPPSRTEGRESRVAGGPETCCCMKEERVAVDERSKLLVCPSDKNVSLSAYCNEECTDVCLYE